MKARVTVFCKEAVFDPQGHTLAVSLRQVGFPGVKGTRVGKVIDIELSSNSVAEAKASVQQMCEKLLANPVIESFSYEIKE
ncbi:phosphoribosylformylglycinamidine synthase subunit PurS [bacterium]|nr:phosphoribosylformylglycinamidine synthase subunit PurS [bacterium]